MEGNASTNARDRGLALISRINRWMIAGAVALTGLVSLVASQSFHGRTLSNTAASSGSSSGASGSGSSDGSTSSSSSAGSIQQPAQAPSPAQAPVVPSAPVVSGGS